MSTSQQNKELHKELHKESQTIKTDTIGKCILSFFPSDGILPNINYNIQTILRISPYSANIKYKYYKSSDDWETQHVSTDFNYRQLIEYEEQKNIYYMNLGSNEKDSKFKNGYFATPHWTWPNSYTMLIWVKWDMRLYTLTTFDSGGSVPIVVSNKTLAVDRAHNWVYTKYIIEPDKWQFIAVIAGDMSSTFYIGDLEHKPRFLETIKNDICGQETYKMGNSGQGPGQVAMIQVFDYKIDVKQIEDEYYSSRYEISLQWTDEEVKIIKVILKKCIVVDGIVDCVISYSSFYRQK